MNNPYLISEFSTVKDNRPKPAEIPSWPIFVGVFESFASEPCERKEDRRLFASCRFATSRRCKHEDNISSAIALDIDHKMTIEFVRDLLTEFGFDAILYTTASHSPQEHRFRVILPLDRDVRDTEYRHLARLLSTEYCIEIDASKVGCESLFYLPATYTGCPDNRFIVVEGHHLAVDELFADFPIPAPEAIPAPQQFAIEKPPVSRAQRVIQALKARSMRAIDLTSIDAIPPKFIDDYVYIRKADSHWNGLFTFMLQVAGYAKFRQQDITVCQLANLARDIDSRFTNGKLERKGCDFERRATDALRLI